MTFPSLPALLNEALTARGYTALTPVQAHVIEPEAQGRDLIVSAQTGSGKTVAFGLAMAPMILSEEGNLPPAAQPLALIIAPTRELALQVSRELMWLYGQAGARIATCVGGMDASKERRNLSYGAHIVVGTPGRLRDHLERGALDLSALRCAVLDEADEMLDMGFREDLEQILDGTPEGRATFLFSATMPKPIVALAKRYQKDALRISTVGEDRGHGDISYQCVTVAPSDIENVVVNLLRFHEAESAMLFCATRDNVRHLHASLIERGFAAVALSGEHSQNERNAAMQQLRDKRARVCVATDVAARGIDLPSLTLVVHVEIPRDAETLQHRSGRTGRAGKKGTAVLIVPYPRRKRVEGMLRGARINAEWIGAPTAADIAKNDHARLLTAMLEPVDADEDDRALAAEIMAQLSGEDIATALVKMHRAKMPVAEEMVDHGARPAPAKEGPRQGFEDTVWFSMGVGRDQNADPRWILPLICRRAHITKNEIGAIRIAATETVFEVPRAAAARMMDALSRTSGTGENPEDDIAIVKVDGIPKAALRSRDERAPRGGGDRPERSGHSVQRRDNADRPRPNSGFGDRPDRGPRPDRGDRTDRPRFDKPAGERTEFTPRATLAAREGRSDRPSSPSGKPKRIYKDRPNSGPPRSAGGKPSFGGGGGKPFKGGPKGPR
jgi:ATP-dependent RNA helicase DeaD